MTSPRFKSGAIAPSLVALGIIIAAVCTRLFPAVEGLGTKVRLPVFHGAMTWVNLGAFSLLAVCALIFLITRRDVFYRFAEALRWIAVSMWLVGSVLGTLAALNTWDFTGSKSSPLEVAAADPRLMAQFWVVFAALAVLALELILADKRWTAVVDIGFVALLWTVLMRAILGPGRALHPDSPVMNSDEIGIKLYFFGIVGGIGLATLSAVWMVARARMASKSLSAGEGSAEESLAV